MDTFLDWNLVELLTGSDELDIVLMVMVTLRGVVLVVLVIFT